MFIDEVTVEVIAGDGGNGCMAFRREKFIEMGGPYGGNGGKGADIIFKVDQGLNTLFDLRYRRVIKGERGSNGLGKGMHGKSAENVIVKVPEGTQPGQILKVRGKGVKDLRTGIQGDQYITLNVETPTKLTKEQRELLSKFASLGSKGESIFDKFKIYFQQKWYLLPQFGVFYTLFRLDV